MANTSNNGDGAKRRLKFAGPSAYEVGYGKPPGHSKFKPGKSGNPKGRPRGASNRLPALHQERLKTIILEEAYRTIKVREGEKNVSVPIAKAVIRAVAVNAARGNNRAGMLFTQMVKVVEDQARHKYDLYLQVAIDYKCNWEREIERCKRLGIKAPNPIPHPDDIRINFSTSEVWMAGPFCKEEIPIWEKARQSKKECDAENSNSECSNFEGAAHSSDSASKSRPALRFQSGNFRQMNSFILSCCSRSSMRRLRYFCILGD